MKRRTGGPAHRRTLIGLLLCAGTSVRPCTAQCPDGSPPPCGRPVALAVAPAIDPHRIAILPFRVTTADSLLGEGMAELVATEFTGENSPRAVNMGTVLRAWRSAGGGLRSPLAQDRAIRLARDMGAGSYVEGSVVGLGSRLTINASIVSVSGGETRRATAVSGPADSLDVLVSRVTTGLLASAGANPSANARMRLTDSPAAMRFYLEGLAHWRALRIQPAATSFERAVAEDPLFARAAFMRWSVGQWGALGSEAWGPRVLALAPRLSAADQLLIAGPLGDGRPRSRAEDLAARIRAADGLPESAEAQYFAGDLLYHYGPSLDIDDAMARAVRYFERSVALDSQGTVLEHLLEIAFVTGDSALGRRVWPGLERSLGGAWDYGMAVALLRRDAAMYAAQRRRAESLGGRPQIRFLLPETALPWAGRREIFALSDSLESVRFVAPVAPPLALGALIAGRPAEARRAVENEPDSLHARTDAFLVAAALFGDGDRGAGDSAVSRLRLRPDTTPAGTRATCVLGLWSIARGETLSLPDPVFRRHEPTCAAVLDGAAAMRDHRANARDLLMLADSAVRATPIGSTGYPSVGLARLWEEFGDRHRALLMTRVRVWGFANYPEEAVRRREEGRLAALDGDTTGAIRAYQSYLALRRDAEPSLIPQRDSVQAAVARLTRQ
jgi:hypothetical protein